MTHVPEPDAHSEHTAATVDERVQLHGLFVEDDPEYRSEILPLLPTSVDHYDIAWETCDAFDDAIARVRARRYDLVVTDLYRGDIAAGEAQGKTVVHELREQRFVPIVAISSGPRPEGLDLSFFVRFTDKAKGDAAIAEVTEHIRAMITSGLIDILRRLHDDIDRSAGSYVWELLEKRWTDLGQGVFRDAEVLERVLRRRAAVQLGRIDSGGGTSERASVEGAEFYLWPPLSGDEYRLGEVVRKKSDASLRVILTPHCLLTVQPKAKAPRAEFVLTAKIIAAEAVFAELSKAGKAPWSGNEAERTEKLRKRITCPPGSLGEPSGRYWFFPSFLDIPNAYCDFMQVDSVPHAGLSSDYEALATLDAPFAEALQSAFLRFYGSVGIPPLITDRFADMIK